MAVTRKQFKDLAANFVDSVFADFTKEFTFQSLVRTPDGQGGFTVAWTDFATVRGFVKILKGGESEVDGHLKARYQTKFMFEFIPGLSDEMRIVYDGDNYNIREIQPIMDVDVFINVIADEDDAT